jgi:membrane fusion protein
MSDLFRREAVEWNLHRLHGDVLVLPRVSHTVTLGFLIFFVLAATWWLTKSSYARKETVHGWLEPKEGVTRIYAEDSGVIKKVLVREGERVLKDQPLIIVNDDRFLANGELLETRLLTEYETQLSLLNEQLDRTTRIYQRRQLDIQGQIDAVEQDLILLNEQHRTLGERHEFAKEQVERQQTLQTKGFVSATDLESSIAHELALRNEKQALRRERINRLNAIDKLRVELELLPDQSANDILQLRTRLSDVVQKIAQLYGQRSYVIKSTRDGQVNNLQIHAGQQVYAGSKIPLFTLNPIDTDLSAHLLVPVRSAGFVETGQALDIRYDAFPYQKFGLYKGEIVSVSDTVLMPNEILNVPLSVQEPVFRVDAHLMQRRVRAYGKEFPLKPGMTLTADVRLADRTLLQWLLEPIYSMKGRL